MSAISGVAGCSHHEDACWPMDRGVDRARPQQRTRDTGNSCAIDPDRGDDTRRVGAAGALPHAASVVNLTCSGQSRRPALAVLPAAIATHRPRASHERRACGIVGMTFTMISEYLRWPALRIRPCFRAKIRSTREDIAHPTRLGPVSGPLQAGSSWRKIAKPTPMTCDLWRSASTASRSGDGYVGLCGLHRLHFFVW